MMCFTCRWHHSSVDIFSYQKEMSKYTSVWHLDIWDSLCCSILCTTADSPSLLEHCKNKSSFSSQLETLFVNTGFPFPFESGIVVNFIWFWFGTWWLQNCELIVEVDDIYDSTPPPPGLSISRVFFSAFSGSKMFETPRIMIQS